MRTFVVKSKDDRDAFYKILIVLNEIFSIRRSALRVLANLMYYNWKYKHLPKKQRDLLIFSYETLRDIEDYLGITGSDLRNQITYLRKNGYLKGRSLVSTYELDLDDYSIIAFKIERNGTNEKSVHAQS
jgi:hypothetical protein